MHRLRGAALDLHPVSERRLPGGELLLGAVEHFGAHVPGDGIGIGTGLVSLDVEDQIAVLVAGFCVVANEDAMHAHIHQIGDVFAGVAGAA